MANHLSALKRVRQTLQRTAWKRQHRTRLRHQIRAFRSALKSKDVNAALALAPKTISVIDRAAQRGLLKKNTAARFKSRLAGRLNALQAGGAPGN